jgi:hypothetical protein
VGNYISYLLNVGHTPDHIYSQCQRHFFDRELHRAPHQELQAFFVLFPGRKKRYKVYAGVSEQMYSALDDIAGVNMIPDIPAALRERHNQLIGRWGSHMVEFSHIEAPDLPGAWSECVRSLSLTRALAYTGKPAADMTWDTEMVISSADDMAGYAFDEPLPPLRRRYRGNPGEAEKIVNQRRSVISRETLTDQDRNRLVNTISGYADAFHSESPAMQLVSLWSSLEARLPSPAMGPPRIQSFLKDVRAGQQRMYLENQFTWLYIELIKLYHASLDEVLKDVTEYQTGVAKLFGALSFVHHEPVRSRLGQLCAGNPLATQRMFELYTAAKSCGRLFALVTAHLDRVSWHLLRIYRERNRIVHRANPSVNATSLIMNLNEYILVCMEAFFRAASADDGIFSVDDIFSEISTQEEA